MFTFHPLSESTRRQLIDGGVDPDAVVRSVGAASSGANGWSPAQPPRCFFSSASILPNRGFSFIAAP